MEAESKPKGVQKKTLLIALAGAMGFGFFALMMILVLFLLSRGGDVNIVEPGALPEDIQMLSSVEIDHFVMDSLGLGERGDHFCLLYTSPSPRDGLLSRMPSSA